MDLFQFVVCFIVSGALFWWLPDLSPTAALIMRGVGAISTAVAVFFVFKIVHGLIAEAKEQEQKKREKEG
ncbi:MAG: hypothetical protein WCK11_02425 [Candidatus Falkowbacteria bacterium]